MSLDPYNSFISPPALFNELTISQYQGSPKFMGILDDAIGSQLENVFELSNSILQATNFSDQINGQFLDLIGWLIGLPRMNVQVSETVWQLDVTSFTGHKFGDESYISFALATDDQYRFAILSYATTQTSIGNLDSLKRALSLILYQNYNSGNIEIILNSSLSVSINCSVAVPIANKYLVENYLAPNGQSIWPRVAGCIYNFNIPTIT